MSETHAQSIKFCMWYLICEGLIMHPCFVYLYLHVSLRPQHYILCDWICKRSYTCNYIYLEIQFEIFNSIYLENDQSCLHMFLHKSIAIHGNSLCLLYTGQLAEFPTMLDSFMGVANTTSTLIGREGGGRWGATKWQAKATSSLKTAK